uniref:Major vault protein n=1 Tax=Oryzias sinensis TaxID=183150 RepID=A0A8C8E2D3_9TELE
MRMRTMTQGRLSVNDVTAAPLAQRPRPLLHTNSALVQLSVSDDPDLTADPRNQQQPQNREPSQRFSPEVTRPTRMEKQTEPSIIRIPPHHYIHVLDQNTNIARVEIGPLTYIRQDNEKVLFLPVRMIMVPPRHFCVVSNPVARDDDNQVLFDQSGQAKLRHADLEIRLTQDPFPLYPGEEVKQAVTPLQIVYPDTALRLQALLDFEDDEGLKRVAGDEWLFEGPGTYIPRKEVVVLETIKATVIRENQAIRLRARKEGKDRGGVQRVTGEEWLVSKVGAYLPGAHEEVIDIVNAFILTDKKALHVRALRPFKDAGGHDRRTGEEWLVTMADREAHIPSVAEEVVDVVDVTTLNSRQYCVILDPVGPDGKPQLGQKKVVKGERSFFLQPGEQLENGIQNVYVLSEDEGLVLRAVEAFTDTEHDGEEEEEDPEEERRESGAKRFRSGDIVRRPGDRWMLRGPIEYVPPINVEVVLKQHAIPLDENEGIYVRDMKTGKVRAVIGHTYMLNQDEELWEKELPANVEALLTSRVDPLADRSTRFPTGDGVPRNKTRVVTFRVPHNAAVQVYDYREKRARVVFGPELVMLGPDEQFTMLSLSGDKPKRANVIKAICLLLGPDFFTDIITIETADHARLQLQLSYNWHFHVKPASDVAAAAALFSVPDFVGDASKAIASRIRGAVASVQFDDFHKNSNRIICSAVFGFDEKMAVRSSLRFPQNNLIISSVDIQSVEPVDQRTRDALQKSVQLAIEITTNSQEATARHEAERLEQEAQGKLERQKITDQAQAEKARKELLELEALSAAVESTGAAKAEAQSRAEAARIQGEAAVNEAKLKAEAMRIEAEAELERLAKAREQELSYKKQMDSLEVEKQAQLSDIESKRFHRIMESLGGDTLREIARAGPELQVKMLQSLGLKSTIITDGSSPINLFTTATGLVGALPGQGQS